jgi:DNA repair protein RadD
VGASGVVGLGKKGIWLIEMLKEREYQTRAVAELLKRFKVHQRIVAVSPTGSGKTFVAAILLRQFQKKRVLWVAHRLELLYQAADHLKTCGVPRGDIGIFSGTKKDNVDARILLASVDMFRAHLVPKVDLIVVDEAHRVMANSYQEITFAQPKALVLGLTATPERLDGKPLGDVFQDMLLVSEAMELIQDGYLSRPSCYGVDREVAEAMTAGIGSRHGDFDNGQLGEAMSGRQLVGNVVHECARLAGGLRTIVFAVNRAHGKTLFDRFQESGRPSAYLDGETEAVERASIVDGLKSGRIEVVVNVEVLSEGFDCESVKCIALARPTKSLTMYLQQVGRSMRPFEGVEPVVLDHAGNVWRHSLPDMPRKWSLDGRPEGYGPAPVKSCIGCKRIIYASARKCPHCGAEQPFTLRELAEQELALQRIRDTEDMLASRRAVVVEIAKRRGASEDFVERVMSAYRG